MDITTLYFGQNAWIQSEVSIVPLDITLVYFEIYFLYLRFGTPHDKEIPIEKNHSEKKTSE